MLKEEAQNKTLSHSDLSKIKSYFSDRNLSNLLIQEIEELYQMKQQKYPFHFYVSLEDLHFYIYLNKEIMSKSDTTDSEQDPHQIFDTSYAIRISKKFPVGGVRVYPLNNPFQPRIFDSRDLMYQILGDIWTHKNRLSDILLGLQKFEKKLFQRNEKYLSMQKTGQFQMGDIFSELELKKFGSLDTFKDLWKEDGPIVGTTETHFLVFKSIPTLSSKNLKIYQITRACDLQCVHQVRHHRLQNQIIITMYKYRSIKNFNQYEKISRQYRFQNSELFLRNILKHVTKFQKIEINLETSMHWKGEQEFDVVSKRMNESKDLQAQFESHYDKENRQTVFTKLSKNYQRLIEYFSARASCYYLIYVNKLNNLYAFKNE